MRTTRAALLAGLMTASVMCAEAAAQTPGESLSVGPDLPPQGRSLFDRLVYAENAAGTASLQLPFPFRALVAQLRARLQLDAQPEALPVVLIPLGRSLQRNTAAPRFFESPRVVLAVLGESARPTAPLAKDRLYLGYQERSGVIEVISYNDDLGRFEFQIVKNYRAQTRPRLFYAKRAICVACHQNQAPMFPRPLWSETHANPPVAARLHAARADFHGVDLSRGIDVPAAIDAATDRANRYVLEQRLWQEGCASLIRTKHDGADTRCRIALLDAALKLRLSGWRGYADGAAATLGALRTHWREQWPDGWAVPNPDIPNRDPLMLVTHAPLRAVPVSAGVDPLRLRPSLERLAFNDPAALDSLIQGLANTFTEADIAALDAHLFARDAVPLHEYPARCKVQRRTLAPPAWRLDLQCASAPDTIASVTVDATDGVDLQGRLYFNGNRLERGVLDRLRIGTEQFSELTVSANADMADGRLRLTPYHEGLHARRINGHALARLILQLPDAAVKTNGEAMLLLGERRDYTAVDAALQALATPSAAEADASVLATRPLRREPLLRALHRRLGEAAPEFCCDKQTLPPAELEAYRPPPAQAEAAFDPAFAAVLPTLQRYCATCHASAESFPPNFLSGTAREVRVKLAQCAERIDYRTSMWTLDEAARFKSPMPPAVLVPSPERLQDDAEWQRLRAYIGALHAARPLSATQDYEQLTPCLAEDDR